ncbi:hypothetical protein [Reichenbachiella versicolor]|uniref:hypothetical protein n=1 Tax=Reichenbachiella versicolor TaxID=1821036 RepID=UPI000D6DEFD9|nr:hypothetical protein [Reichenbachiella versicolor]
MQEYIIKCFIVFLGSTFKIIFGVLLGTSFEFSVFMTATLTILGMMAAIYIVTFFGTPIRHYSQRLMKKKEKKLFSPKTRRYVRIWQKYGVPGIAFLTPLLFMPIGGAVLANAFGGKKSEIFKWMWIACIVETYPITWIVKFASDLVPFADDVLDSLSGFVDFFL